MTQGRRRFLKSGTAIERHRRSSTAEARAGVEHERGSPPPPRKGGLGDLPRENFEFNMSVEAILMHFEAIFACKIRLIVQAFHVAVFKCISNPITKD